MKETTITEALAELKVITKRIENKRQFVLQHLLIGQGMKDPLEKDGGSPQIIARELQSIHDLEEEQVRIRRAIAAANANNTITIAGEGRSIADWLTWRREISAGSIQFLREISKKIQGVRGEAARRGLANAVVPTQNAKADDIVVNLSEAELGGEIERLDTTLGTLDGLLSLRNATIVVTY